jgi:hypothetical protein
MIAEAKALNIRPIISRVLLLTLEAAILIMLKLIAAPADAARESGMPDENPAITAKATPTPAPEVRPSTSGPVSGFLKRLWVSSPPRDKPTPQRRAVSAFGSLISKMTISQSFLDDPFPVRILKVSEKGMLTDPKNRSAVNNAATRAARVKNRAGR